MRKPNCVGFIMDGNRRWAKGKGVLSLKGHEAGAQRIKEVVEWSAEAGIQHLIFYTFSTENWNRSIDEVSYLLDLLGVFIDKEVEFFNEKGGAVHFVGDLSKFSDALVKKFENAVEETKKNEKIHVYFALNYGGRAEILSAVKKILEESPALREVTEEYFEKHLQSYPMPNPDLIVRTSGEMRLSGFLPWQSAYSELFFLETYWPDFSYDDFKKVLEVYDMRERRMGK